MIRALVAAIFILVGAVWIAQGSGALGGSFMTGDAVWTVIGFIAVLFGGALLLGAIRDRRRAAQGDR